MANDTYVQVAPDSSGKKIRNLETTTSDKTGTQNTVEQQVVISATPDGRVLDASLPGLVQLLLDIRTEMRVQTALMIEAFGIRNPDPERMRNDPEVVGEAPASGDGGY